MHRHLAGGPGPAFGTGRFKTTIQQQMANLRKSRAVTMADSPMDATEPNEPRAIPRRLAPVLADAFAQATR